MADSDQETPLEASAESAGSAGSAESAESGAAPESLGQMLRNARLAQDLTLEQLATELRIEAKQLRALEEDSFEQIGVPVFIKGYLKQYGARLGLNVADLLALYYKQTTLGDVQVQPSRTIKLRDERQITTWVLAAIVLLSVAVGLAVWWWNGGSFASASRPSPPPAVAPAGDAESPEPQSVAGRVGPLSAAPADDLRAAPVSGVAEPNAGGVPAEALPEPTPAELARQEPVPEAPATDRARAAPVVPIPLELTFEAENWVEISDGRGQRVLFGFQSAGKTVTVRGEPPFAVVLGNADSVRIVVDGEPFAIPTAGREGGLARFSVDIAEE